MLARILLFLENLILFFGAPSVHVCFLQYFLRAKNLLRNFVTEVCRKRISSALRMWSYCHSCFTEAWGDDVTFFRCCLSLSLTLSLFSLPTSQLGPSTSLGLISYLLPFPPCSLGAPSHQDLAPIFPGIPDPGQVEGQMQLVE